MSHTRSFVSLIIASVVVFGLPQAAFAAQPGVGLGTATSFSVLAGSTVTNTGPSVISGDLGLSPGSDVTGFPPGLVINGTQHVTNALALQAQNDLTTAYNDAAGRTPVVDKTGQDLGGQTLVAGVYQAANEMDLTGTVTLDAQGDPNAVFIFQAGSTLITASSSTVALLGGARSCNVFWQVGSSATLGTNTTFVGSIMALTDANLQTGAVVEGRVLARNGQVTLDTNTITRPACDTTTADEIDEVDEDVEEERDAAGNSGGGGNNGSGGNGNGGNGSNGGNGGGGGNNSSGGSDSPRGPVVPSGHPETGMSPGGQPRGNGLLFLGLLALGAAAGAGAMGQGVRRSRPTHAR